MTDMREQELDQERESDLEQKPQQEHRRLEHSARNLVVTWLGQSLYAICNFIALGFFAAHLSQNYMGVQGLFTSVLTVLSLSELGIASAISYALYKPIAENDIPKIRSLMRLFKRAYIVIGISLMVIGLVLLPFIQYLIKGGSGIALDELRLYFLCFVVNSALSYFFSYKGVLITAHQRKSVVASIQYSTQIVMCLLQVLVLILTSNYLLFLGCMLGMTLLQNIIIVWRANRMYPYLREKSPIKPIDQTTLTGIKKNVFALVLHRIAGIAALPASTIIISTNVNLSAVASYTVYNGQIIAALARVLDQVFDAIVASVGSLVVTESAKRQLEVFETTFFVNAFLYAVASVSLVCVVDDFVGYIWLGTDYLFPPHITVLLVILFFLRGMRSAGLSFTAAYGLYWFTRYKAILETVVLLVLCLVLVVNLQIAGVIIAGIISTLCISVVYEGYMLFKHGLQCSSRRYFLRFMLYTVLTFVFGGAAYFLGTLVVGHGVIPVFIKLGIALAVSCTGFCLVFLRSRELRECFLILKRLIEGVRSRSKSAGNLKQG
jgi:O-antigen/teichoic acid export membrane protein